MRWERGKSLVACYIARVSTCIDKNWLQYITSSVVQLSRDNSIRDNNGVKDAVDMEH